MEYGYLIVSILVIGVAHYIRVLRWRLFIDVYEQPNMKLLLQALSIGYLCNFFLPFKMGDVIRSYIAGKKMRNGYPLSLSSIIVDRYLDIIVVGMLFGILSTYRAEIEIVEEAAKLYFGLAISILVFTIIVYIGRRFFKKGIKFVASIFNVSIEKKILHVAWALVWNFKDIILKINKKKLIIYTIVMWALYILSYILFSYFMTLKGTVAHWSDIVIVLFSSNSLTTDYYSLPFMGYFNISSDISVYFSIYMFTAAILMYAVSYINIFNNVVYSNDSKEGYLNLLPQLNSKEQLSFLESYFSDSNREYIYNYLKLNQSISIIRDFSAGSNATTMLCTDGEKTFFRKYAFGEDGDKLYQQIEWILSNKDILPLPEVLSYEHNNIYSYYDMPYNSGTTGLFSYVHSMPIKEVWKLISEALTCMEQSIYKVNARPADIESIKKYISSKVDRNIEKIENGEYIKPLLKYDEILINGVEYKNLNYFKKYLDNNLLADIFSSDTYSVIHGDLTIENIICKRDIHGKDDFYIIDPNTGNVHDSSNLDYGKLLQSIHGCYEFLMATKSVEVEDNKINFMFTKSAAYTELHKRLKEYMDNNFTKERVRSIYFHEIIHWLRLMPYKINKIGRRSVLFYAGMIMVMNDVIKWYGGDLGEK